MPLRDKEVIATFKWCKQNNNGKPIGISNDNQILNTRIYEFELLGGAVEEFSANATSENLWCSATKTDLCAKYLTKYFNIALMIRQ